MPGRGDFFLAARVIFGHQFCMKTVSPRRWWPFAALLAVAALLCFGVPALVAGQMTGTLANARSLQTAITMMAVDTNLPG